MDGSGIGSGDKDESNCLKEVVSDVAGMTNCVFREPGEGKAGIEIANRLVVGIGDHGKQILLAADYRAGRTVLRSAPGHPDAKTQDGDAVTLFGVAPTLDGRVQDSLNVGGDLEGEAKRIEHSSQWEVHLA